ncbi:MAG: hypothetical protein SWY16_05415 [Cyanobacteriota bacterium]|nr:hypothetical protein [Cyanobacteriota bacterium]
MPLFEFPELLCAQVGLLLVSIRWMLRRNDETLLLIHTFLFYVTGYRYLTVANGWNRWVDLTHFGFNAIDENLALQALSYIVLGQICLTLSYMYAQTQVIPVLQPIRDRPLFRWLRWKAILLGLLCLPLVVLIRARVASQVGGGRSLAFEVSGYLNLFPMVLIGVAALIICLWKFGGLPTFTHKVSAILIVFGVVYLTYTPHSRFNFLAWIIACGIILSSSYRAKTRLISFFLFAVLGMSLFAVAGATRNFDRTRGDLNQIAIERALSAEDGNMLDGFVLLRQVYPKQLDFSLGMQHLEILMRPIPRSLWPGKPVGGYMNKLGNSIRGGKGTLGISPTVFGIFYSEGGILGIIFFSGLYGIIWAKIIRSLIDLHPFASILARAIFCAALVPILRSGDIAGNYAWIGMAFWPCFGVLWYQRCYFQSFYRQQPEIETFKTIEKSQNSISQKT